MGNAQPGPALQVQHDRPDSVLLIIHEERNQPMDPELDPYRVLGVEPTASLLDIARARRRLAKLHHPDLAAGDAAASEMGRINAAWTLLADADARAAWDRSHGLGPGGTTPATTTTWTEWAYAPPTPRPRATAGSGGNTAWWVLGAFMLFLIVIVAGGIVSTLDRPADLEIAPWLQENLDR